MWHLITLEARKWRKHRATQVLVIFYLILLPGLMIGASYLPEMPPPLGSPKAFVIFPNVWQYLGYIGNWLVFFFFGFFSVIFITTEFANKTYRQNIITGLSRQQLFWGKYAFLLLVAFLATLYYIIVALGVGAWHTDTLFMSKVFQHTDYFWRYFLMSASYMTFGFFIAILVRRTGIALFLYLSYVMFVEPMLRWAIHQNIAKHPSMHWYPMNATEDLCPVPFARMAEEFAEEFGFSFFLESWEAGLITLIYMAIFVALAWWRMKRSDL